MHSPQGDKIIAWIMANIDNSTLAALDGFRQQRIWNMSGKRTRRWKTRAGRKLAGSVYLAPNDRHKVLGT